MRLMTPVAKFYTGKMAVSVISEGKIILFFITKNKIGVLQSNLNIFKKNFIDLPRAQI